MTAKRKKPAPVLWVVEMETTPGKCEPTVGVSIHREGGRYVLGEWRKQSPGVVFRLRKYRRDEAHRA